MLEIHLEKDLFKFTAAVGSGGRERRHRRVHRLQPSAVSATSRSLPSHPNPPPSWITNESRSLLLRYSLALRSNVTPNLAAGYLFSVFGFDFSQCFVGFRFILVKFKYGGVEEIDMDWRVTLGLSVGSDGECRKICVLFILWMGFGMILYGFDGYFVKFFCCFLC